MHTERTVHDLRRAADYAQLDEGHRSLMREAADLLDAASTRELAGLSTLDSVLALLTSPEKYKALRDRLAADFKQARAAIESAQNAAVEASKAQASAVKALADVQRTQAGNDARAGQVEREARRLVVESEKLAKREAAIVAEEERLSTLKQAVDDSLEKVRRAGAIAA